VTWDLPTRIFTLPAAHMSDSLIFWEQKPLGHTGFPAWDQKQQSSYHRIATVGTAQCARDDQSSKLKAQSSKLTTIGPVSASNAA
jgi:hypothetical protein